MINLAITKTINQFGLHKIDYFTELISYIPFLITILVIISMLIIKYDKTNRKNILTALFILLILVFTISELMIKKVVHIERPYLKDSSITPIGYHFKDSSFPSTHVASVLGISFILINFYKNKKVIIMLGLLSFAVGFSRLHNGMHYPIDIIIGSFIGFICATITLHFQQKNKNFRR